MPGTAILVGASGLIGSYLLDFLLKEPFYTKIVLLLRKPMDIQHPKIEQQIIDFDQLYQSASLIKGDVIFSCLGTTRQKTPDKQQYLKIDNHYPFEIARIGRENGVPQFHIVSSLGADPNSNSFYLKQKGNLEEKLKMLNYPSLHLYRPSYLEGTRKEKRLDDILMRPLMKILNLFFIGSLKNYRSIKAETVALAMIKQSLKNLQGIYIYPSQQIKELA
ncbi:MAG TPA: NAD(P)H-binding protein [Daejeonella sp.]|nr:NAD(P)H-binding protein [Daejeonella sp.]